MPDQNMGQRLEEEARIRAVIARYARSVEMADPELAGEIWLHGHEVSLIHPRGHERGWNAVRDNFFVRSMGERFSRRRLTVRDMTIRVYGEVAWTEFYWDFAATFREDGRTLATSGRETQLFRKVEGDWRIVHVHFSLLPVTGAREGV